MGTMRHLNWLNADKLQRYTHSHPSLLFSILHASVSFPPSGATTVTHVLRGEWNHPQGFFAAIFTSSWLSTSLLCENDLLLRVQMPRLAYRSSVCLRLVCVFPPLYDLSNFFLGAKSGASECLCEAKKLRGIAFAREITRIEFSISWIAVSLLLMSQITN